MVGEGGRTGGVWLEKRFLTSLPLPHGAVWHCIVSMAVVLCCGSDVLLRLDRLPFISIIDIGRYVNV